MAWRLCSVGESSVEAPGGSIYEMQYTRKRKGHMGGGDEDQGVKFDQEYVCSKGDFDGSVRLSKYKARPQVIPISRPIQVKVVM